MSGSVRKFIYESDDGNNYFITRDESNTETLNIEGEEGTLDLPSQEPKYPYGKDGTRYALLYQVDNPQVKRKVTVLTKDVFGALNATQDFSLAVVGSAPKNFRISALIGEKRVGLATGDTGQDDGDDDAD